MGPEKWLKTHGHEVSYLIDVQTFIKMVNPLMSVSLSMICDLLFLGAETNLVCCDKKMVETLETNLRMASGIFGRCQSCLKNMQLSICGLTCSPEHSRYMTPTIATHEPGES